MAEEKRRVSRVDRREIVVSLPVVNAPSWLQGFVDFIRTQGVVGLAVGLILGVAAKSVIDSLVSNIFNPIVGVLTGGIDLTDKYICIKHDALGACASKISYGQFLSDIISFIIVAGVVYFVIKGLKLDRIDKKKE